MGLSAHKAYNSAWCCTSSKNQSASSHAIAFGISGLGWVSETTQRSMSFLFKSASSAAAARTRFLVLARLQMLANICKYKIQVPRILSWICQSWVSLVQRQGQGLLQPSGAPNDCFLYNICSEKQILPRIFYYLRTAENFQMTIPFMYNFRSS